jgi:hypothetical protein
MRQQNFENCLLLLESQTAECEWNSVETLEECGNTNWSNQFNKIRKTIVTNVQDAVEKIKSFVESWKHQNYLIGISYAHYDSVPPMDISGYENDVDLINQLSNKLALEYGEHRILFDKFEPAKDLFDDNMGQCKSLSAYESCRYYVILWNFWTSESENCKNERKTILERCKDDTSKCMFLQTGRPSDPNVPEGYFSINLSADTLDSICDRIKELVNGLLG